MDFLSNDKKLRLKRKNIFIGLFGCDFFVIFFFTETSNFTLDSDWLVNNHSLILCDLKTPYALKNRPNGPLLHLLKSTQFKHPYYVYVKQA